MPTNPLLRGRTSCTKDKRSPHDAVGSARWAQHRPAPGHTWGAGSVHAGVLGGAWQPTSGVRSAGGTSSARFSLLSRKEAPGGCHVDPPDIDSRLFDVPACWAARHEGSRPVPPVEGEAPGRRWEGWRGPASGAPTAGVQQGTIQARHDASGSLLISRVAGRLGVPCQRGTSAPSSDHSACTCSIDLRRAKGFKLACRWI